MWIGMNYDSCYERYLYAEEADVTECALTWDVEVGLQAVDGLQVSGYLRMLYPDNPRHSRQKYRLTARGALVWQDLRR